VLDRAALEGVRRWRFRGGPGVAEVPVEFVLRA
jgi:outer membrane biosynthesis protein TonB